MLQQHIPHRQARCLCYLLILVLAFLTAPAAAQFSRLGVEPFKPVLSESEIEHIEETFALSEEQTAQVHAALQTYLGDFREAESRMRRLIRGAESQAREGVTPEQTAQRMQELGDEWRTTTESLEAAFFEQVQAIWAGDDAPAWERYQQDWRRRSTLQAGARFPGEAVDLIVVAEMAGLDASAGETRDILDRYRQEFDGALVLRNEVIFEMFAAQADPERRADVSTIYLQVVSDSAAVRDVNRKYVRILCTALDDDACADLQHAFNAACFPQVYVPTTAERFLESLIASEALDETQRQDLQNLHVELLESLAVLNDRLVTVLLDESDAAVKRRLTGAAPEQTGGSGDPQATDDQGPRNSIQLLLEEKQQLVSTAIDRAWDLLTPEQQEQVRKPQG